MAFNLFDFSQLTPTQDSSVYSPNSPASMPVKTQATMPELGFDGVSNIKQLYPSTNSQISPQILSKIPQAYQSIQSQPNVQPQVQNNSIIPTSNYSGDVIKSFYDNPQIPNEDKKLVSDAIGKGMNRQDAENYLTTQYSKKDLLTTTEEPRDYTKMNIPYAPTFSLNLNDHSAIGLAENLAKVVGNVPSDIYNIGAGTANIIGGVATHPIDTIGGMVGGVVDATKSLGNDISQGYQQNGIVGGANAGLSDVNQVIGQHPIQALLGAEGTASLIDTAKNIIKNPAMASEYIKSLPQNVIDTVKNAPETIKQGFNTATEAVQAGYQGPHPINSVGSYLENKGTAARNAIAGLEPNEIAALKNTPTAEFQSMLDQAKEAKGNDYAQTPYHEGAAKANTAFTQIEDNLASSQAQRMESIKNSGVTSIDTSKVRADIVGDIQKTFNIDSINIGKDGKVSINPTAGREALIDTSNPRDIQALQMLERVSKSKSPLQMMDTIKNLQNLIYDNSTPFRVSKDMYNLVKRATGKLNETFKSQLPTEYGDIVKQMSEDIKLKSDLNRVFKASDSEVGNRGELAMKRLASGTTTSSDARNLALKVKERTGIDLIKEARLRQLAMDIVGDKRGSTLFKSIGEGKRGIIEYGLKSARDITPLSKEKTALARTKKLLPKNTKNVPNGSMDTGVPNSKGNSNSDNNSSVATNSSKVLGSSNKSMTTNAGKVKKSTAENANPLDLSKSKKVK